MLILYGDGIKLTTCLVGTLVLCDFGRLRRISALDLIGFNCIVSLPLNEILLLFM